MRELILVIDDDPDHRRLIEYVLTVADDSLDVTAVASVAEAIERGRQSEITCVVLDFNLGMIDADTSLPELRRHYGDTPIVVVSSSDDQEVAIRSFRLGVHDFVPKSAVVRGGMLADHVRCAIDTSRRAATERREAERRHVELRRAAETDALTDLPNRRMLDRLQSDPRFSGDRRRHLAVAMIDLDRFKSINDTWGHAAGDEVLKKAAAIIRDAAGPGAIVARWGGEEVVAINPEASPINAYAWPDRVRRAVRSWVCRPDGQPVTVSVGLAHGSRERALDHLIAGADLAVYLAKDHGRDCVRTEAMANAIELAHSASIRAETPRERLSALFGLLADRMGTEQAFQCRQHAEAVERLCQAASRRAHAEGVGGDELLDAAICHDLGKIAMPECVFEKPGPLSHDEAVMLKTHALMGARIAGALGFGPDTEAMIEFHHRPMDAPLGLRERTSLLAAADMATAMMEDRPYARAMSPSAVVAELRERPRCRVDARMTDAICETIAPDGVATGVNQKRAA